MTIKREKRKSGVFFAIGVLVTIFILLIYYLWIWLLEPITLIRVSGKFEFVSQSAIEELLDVYKTKSRLSVDVSVIKEVLQAIPWIDEVKVKRHGLDKIEILLHEHTPVAMWQDDRVLNIDGTILTLSDVEVSENLPELFGFDGSEKLVMQQFMIINKRVGVLDYPVSKLGWDASGSWWFEVDGVVVQLGSYDQALRLNSFTKMYQGFLKDKWQQIEKLDLRYRNGVAVVWKFDE